MRFRFPILLFIVLLLIASCSHKPRQKRFSFWNFDQMHDVRKSLKRSLFLFNSSYSALIDSADEAISEGPFSVTQRIVLPESGDHRDYMSFGIHWWPDPLGTNGLPYVRREKEVNSDADINLRQLNQVSRNIQTLNMAWFFSREEEYAEKAGELLRTWFLDSLTRMNPNLDHAGAIPGRRTGRSSGVSEGLALVTMLDGIVIAEASGALKGAEEKLVREWYQAYFQWLLESPLALEAGTLTGRHALGREAQLMGIAHFLKDDAFVQQRIPTVTLPLIRKMVGESGRISADLRGNGSFADRVECLEYFFRIGETGLRTEVDVDGYSQSDSSFVRRALDQLIEEYQAMNVSGNIDRTDELSEAKLGNLVRFAAWRFLEPSYGVVWEESFSRKFGHMPELLVLPGHKNL